MEPRFATRLKHLSSKHRASTSTRDLYDKSGPEEPWLGFDPVYEGEGEEKQGTVLTPEAASPAYENSMCIFFLCVCVSCVCFFFHPFSCSLFPLSLLFSSPLSFFFIPRIDVFVYITSKSIERIMGVYMYVCMFFKKHCGVISHYRTFFGFVFETGETFRQQKKEKDRLRILLFFQHLQLYIHIHLRMHMHIHIHMYIFVYTHICVLFITHYKLAEKNFDWVAPLVSKNLENLKKAKLTLSYNMIIFRKEDKKIKVPYSLALSREKTKIHFLILKSNKGMHRV